MSLSSTRRGLVAGALLSCIAGAAAAQPAQPDLCQGYSKDQKITRLATPNRFSKTPATTWQELTRLFEKDRAAIEGVLREKGLAETIEGFFERVSTGQMRETRIPRGEKFEWMLFRRNGQVVTKGPMCFAAAGTYDAFVIEVPVESMEQAAPATCRISATGDCSAHTLSVDASGSSAGASVTMNGRPIQLDAQSRWSGSFENRFDQSYTFTVTAAGTGKKTIRTYTFVVPKVCLNLAFLGATERVEEAPGQGCTQSATVESCPEPQCTITAPAEVERREPFDVTITGNGQVSLESRDPRDRTNSLTSGADGSFTASERLRRKGEHTYSGTVTTEFGDTASCQAVVNVLGGNAWIFRAFGAAIDTDEEHLSDPVMTSAGIERTKIKSGDGLGAGVGAEYLFNDRIGLEASLIYTQADFSYQLDLGNDWAEDSDDVGILTLTIGPNFHLTPNSRVDFYLGPFIGIASIDDPEFFVLGQERDLDFDSEFVWGAQVGLGIPFGESAWSLQLGGRYMDFGVGDNGPRTPELNLDPITLTAGVGYSF